MLAVPPRLSKVSISCLQFLKRRAFRHLRAHQLTPVLAQLSSAWRDGRSPLCFEHRRHHLHERALQSGHDGRHYDGRYEREADQIVHRLLADEARRHPRRVEPLGAAIDWTEGLRLLRTWTRRSCHRTCCATPLPAICSLTGQTFARCRAFLGTPIFQPRRSIPISLMNV